MAHVATCAEFIARVAAGDTVGTVESAADDEVWPHYCIDVAPTARIAARMGAAASGATVAEGESIDPREYGAGPGAKREVASAPDGTPGADGTVPTSAEVDDWFASIARKAEVADVTPGLRTFATGWAREWTGTFAFMVDMRSAASGKRGLSPGQAKGVLNCYRADLQRRPTLRSVAEVATAPAEVAEITPGMYIGADGEIYRVQAARGSGNLYGKRLTSAGFEYAPGSMRTVREGRRMTADEAAEYGRRTGTCCVCARELTRDESIAAGIGPVCASRV